VVIVFPQNDDNTTYYDIVGDFCDNNSSYEIFNGEFCDKQHNTYCVLYNTNLIQNSPTVKKV